MDQCWCGGYTDPLTTDGDIVIRSGGSTTRLGIGSEGQVLKVAGGLPIWSADDVGLIDVVDDTNPQLGGNLDVNGNFISSVSAGDIVIAPDTTGDFIVRGNNTDGSIQLNCTANTHGVKIQSPPHSAAATYTLVLPDNTGANGEVLSTDRSGNLSWVSNAGGGGYTDPLTTDGDIVIRSGGTTTRLGIGSEGQALLVSSGLPVWGNVSGGYTDPLTTDGDIVIRSGGTTTRLGIGSEGQVLKVSSGVPAWAAESGGGGGATRTTQSATTASIADASADNITIQNVGYSGQFITISTDRAAWVTVYSDTTSRTNDAGRSENTDPTPGSGVLAEVITTGAETVRITPAAGYFNDENPIATELYLKVVNKSGATSTVQVDLKVTVVET